MDYYVGQVVQSELFGTYTVLAVRADGDEYVVLTVRLANGTIMQIQTNR